MFAPSLGVRQQAPMCETMLHARTWTADLAAPALHRGFFPTRSSPGDECVGKNPACNAGAARSAAQVRARSTRAARARGPSRVRERASAWWGVNAPARARAPSRGTSPSTASRRHHGKVPRVARALLSGSGGTACFAWGGTAWASGGANTGGLEADVIPS